MGTCDCGLVADADEQSRMDQLATVANCRYVCSRSDKRTYMWGYSQSAAGKKWLFSLPNVTGHFFTLQRTRSEDQSPSLGYLCSRRLRMRYVDESSRLHGCDQGLSDRRHGGSNR